MAWQLNIGQFIGRGEVLRQNIRKMLAQVEARLNALAGMPTFQLPQSPLVGSGPYFRNHLIDTLEKIQAAGNALGLSPRIDLKARERLRTGSIGLALADICERLSISLGADPQVPTGEHVIHWNDRLYWNDSNIWRDAA
ncbi:hypothetical protein AEAC466_04400 [Asticcacaulis sp. AC466]|uniref:hypothetical protein n=1 Tax=Asticcacaulis sp. AC466 TaxID=1282362 RepID=UPI0003C3D883|nr:hypothetical protein [Asticcacaulis sp. AC466]ESQ85411.1 hypothetical protein AEAC466_04400 [Asticcacaulis sp. AC466]